MLAVAKRFAWTWYRLQRLIDRRLADGGSSLSRIRLLAFLNEGPSRSTDIASFFGHAPRTVTQAIDWLETNGYVRRSAVPNDRRVKLIEITESGRVMLTKTEPLYEAITARTFGELDSEELVSLSGVLSHLASSIERLEKAQGNRNDAGQVCEPNDDAR